MQLKTVMPGYHEKRLQRSALRYRLQRRGEEVIRCLRTHLASGAQRILDVGTADGLMLAMINDRTGLGGIGVDLSYETLRAGSRHHSMPLAQADALLLPFPASSFDAVVGAAIIEHVPSPARFVQECWRVVRTEGICIYTAPDPKFDKVYARLNRWEDELHENTFDLHSLSDLLQDAGFYVVEARKFMMSPIGFPAEHTIERWYHRVGLDWLLLNQIAVGRKHV